MKLHLSMYSGMTNICPVKGRRSTAQPSSPGRYAYERHLISTKVHLSMYSGMTHRPCELAKEYRASAVTQKMVQDTGGLKCSILNTKILVNLYR